MLSDEYYLAVNIRYKANDRKIINENNGEEIDILTLEGKKIIFENEVKEWLLKPMKRLLDEDKEDFQKDYQCKPFRNAIFVLFGLFSYIEKIELYRGNGNANDRQSTKRLVDGIKRIFQNLHSREDKEIRDILKRSRHNLMHQAMIGDDILLNFGFGHTDQFTEALDIVEANDSKEIRINPIKMFETIEDDFNNYLESLNNDDELIERFESFFNQVYGEEIKCIENQ